MYKIYFEHIFFRQKIKLFINFLYNKIEETFQEEGCIKLDDNLDFIFIIYVFQYQMIVRSY